MGSRSYMGSTDGVGREEGANGEPSSAVYIQATSLLRDACKELKAGQMVHLPELTFIDSMGAIQILDPRMDGGMYPVSAQMTAECDKMPTGEERRAFDILAPLTYDDLLWIMDRTAACEAEWLESRSLSSASMAQTIYTCLYVHNLAMMRTSTSVSPLARDFLAPFLVSLINCVELVWEEMTKGNLLDGEDFNGDKAGISLAEDVGPEVALQILDKAILDADALACEHKDALRDRLQFRRCFLASALLTSRMTLSSLQDLQRNLHHFATHLDNIKFAAPDMIHAPSAVARAAFDPWFSRRSFAFAQTTDYAPVSLPPIQPSPLPNPDAIRSTYKQVIDGLYEAVQLASTEKGWVEWKIFFDARAIYAQRDQRIPYVRSLWQSVLCTDNQIALKLPLEAIAESFLQKTAGVDVRLLLDDDRASDTSSIERLSSLKKRFNRFIERLAGHLVSYLRSQAQNRSRSKRRMAQVYVDLLNVCDEASALGSDLNNHLRSDSFHADLLFAAVQTLTLDVMLHCIFAGLEVELFRTEELYIVYWMAHKAADEAESVWKGLLAWKGEGAGSSYMQAQALWSASVNRSCLALFHVFKGDDKEVQKGCLSWLQGTQSVVNADNVFEETMRTMFRKRFKWLHIRQRPGSSQHLDALWQAFQAELMAVDDKNNAERLSIASSLLRRSSEDCHKFCRVAASSIVGEVVHRAADSLQQLSALALRESNAIKNGFDSRQSHGTHTLLALRFDGPHPWFPVPASPSTAS